MGRHSSYQLGCLSRTEGWYLVLTILRVSEREECVVALHLPTEPVKRNLLVGIGNVMWTQYLPMS